jgi:hypothetical protein
MVKHMQHGFASRNGLTAAALAVTGDVGIKRVFERNYGGWLSTFGAGDRTYPEDIYAGRRDSLGDGTDRNRAVRGDWIAARRQRLRARAPKRLREFEKTTLAAPVLSENSP